MPSLKFTLIGLVLFFTSATFFVNPTIAANIEPCMEEQCIKYFKKWKIMARAKRALAMSAVGEFYYQGYGTQKSVKHSLKYFRKASRYGFAYAQFRTALIYLMEENYLDNEAGVKYLKKAARNGHSESAFLLALIYGTGDLGVQNDQYSDKWLEQALAANHGTARQYVNYLDSQGKINSDSYPKVEEIVKHFRVNSNDKFELEDESISHQKIQWPQDSSIEVISVSAPSLEALFDYELVQLRKAGPSIQGSTGSRIFGKKCSENLSCYGVDKDDFQRLINHHAGN